jgi:hypothetical protein
MLVRFFVVEGIEDLAYRVVTSACLKVKMAKGIGGKGQREAALNSWQTACSIE